jgi:presenilin 1
MADSDADDALLLGGEDAAGAAAPPDAPSILDEYGEEMTAVLTPVSICMALTAALVLWLNGGSDPPAVIALYYNEAVRCVGVRQAASASVYTDPYASQESDTTSTRVRGALVNALIYVFVVAAMTVLIWLLFRYRFTRVIWGILGLSGVNIFLFMGGQFWLRVLQAANVPLDCITFAILLWNFSVVGVLATFFLPLPLRLKQAYLVFIGVVTALWFTHLPELTTWALLVLMALYDIAAVLSPAGPLRAIVELAQERDEDIPALVYESRPMRRANFGPAEERATSDEPRSADDDDAAGAAPPPRMEIPLAVFDGVRERSPGAVRRPPSPEPGRDVEAAAAADDGSSGLASSAQIGMQHAPPGSMCSSDMESSVKLGLGDFIFYSLLVGRAAMTDTLTAAACYIGIVAGLGATLAALAVVHHVRLPAALCLAGEALTQSTRRRSRRCLSALPWACCYTSSRAGCWSPSW